MATQVERVELAEPQMAGLLAQIGLGVEYVRGEGNTLVYLDNAGQEVPVVDFVGGYGSLIFGHNHPRLVARAQELFDQKVPVHAQFSRHPYANEVAARLSAIVQRETGDDQPFNAIFANSGAEAVEIAMKHAELDRGVQLAAVTAEIDAHLETVRAAGEIEVTAEAASAAGVRASDGIERLLAQVARHNHGRLRQPPVFLALQGGFHGKLVGSGQLTYNPGFREPFQGLATPARFVPTDQPDQVAKIVEEERRSLLDVTIDGGKLRVVERDLPAIAGFVVEPIQGEGGIQVLDRELADEIQRVCAAIDRPVIVDEIQTGMGRSGRFLASSLIGLQGDHYALAKSLGGGLAKAAVLLTRQARYRPEMEMVHSSTYAKDAFSCHLTVEVLEMLEEGGGQAYRQIEERGRELAAALEGVRRDHPDVAKEVRGAGLMLGLELHDQSASSSPVIREHARNGILGYVAAGYLLQAHRVRVFPTASAVNTLRFEPSLLITDAEIDQLAQGLRSLCNVLAQGDAVRLAGG